MEIEAKYAIAGPFELASLESIDLRPYALREAREEVHHDYVLDTSDRVLTSMRFMLRLRYAGRRVIVTFKGSELGSGELHEREEIEAALHAPIATDYRQWPAEIVRRIEPLIGDASLFTLVEMDMHRSARFIVREQDTIAELAIDDGSISANGKVMSVHELEIELKGAGTRDDLQVLQQRLCSQLPLEPEPRSKFERGLMLYE